MEYNFDIRNMELCCYVAPGCGAPVHRNRICHGLVFSVEGNQDYRFDNNKTVSTCENEILYIPKGANYTIDQNKNYACYAANFNFYNKTDFPPFVFKPKNPKNFAVLFQKINDVWTRKPSGYEIKAKSLMYSILFELKKEYEISYIAKSKANLINPAIDYIHNEYRNDNISIAYLSNLCGISEAYFRRIFLKSYGISPVRYINNLKIDRAKELIDSGLYSIKEAAAESGFHDDAYFSRKFKEIIGMSPSEYRGK